MYTSSAGVGAGVRCGAPIGCCAFDRENNSLTDFMAETNSESRNEYMVIEIHLFLGEIV
jgi:hypothetical protein